MYSNAFPVHTLELSGGSLGRDKNVVRRAGWQAYPNLHVAYI